jgi:hypothetical protein
MATMERTYTAEELEQALRPLIEKVQNLCVEIEERVGQMKDEEER